MGTSVAESSPGDGAGIHVIGNGNRVEGNSVNRNDRGIEVDVSGNLVVRNSASSNTDAYGSIVSGNTVGPIVNSGNIASSSNPHANYEF